MILLTQLLLVSRDLLTQTPEYNRQKIISLISTLDNDNFKVLLKSLNSLLIVTGMYKNNLVIININNK
jgi:hypothetical protein